VPSVAFSPTLMPGLDSIGSKRGEHAHHSRKAITTLLDPDWESTVMTRLFVDVRGGKLVSGLCQNCVRSPDNPGHTPSLTGTLPCTSLLREVVDGEMR
jgi:hypothetical protein